MAQPETREAIDAAAARLALALPEACREGVAQNLELLAHHLRIVEACPAEDGRQP